MTFADTVSSQIDQTQVEGTVEFISLTQSGQLELRLSSSTNLIDLIVDQANGNSPSQHSRIQVNGSTRASGKSGTITIPRLDQIQFLSGKLLPLVKNVAELRQMGATKQHIECVAHLEGLVLAASPGRGTFALQDDTGVALLEMKTRDQFLVPGQEIILVGNCLVEGDRVILHNLPVVDNNDTHSMTEESGRIFLSAGKHPFNLLWFNWLKPYGLEVYYQGPGLSRQKIPDAALFSRKYDPATGKAGWVPGLNYRCYEGNWLRVPDFDRLIPVKNGIVTNFDTSSVITRTDNVGLKFSGYIEVPCEGIYTFSTISDDGSLMFIDEKSPSIVVTGTNALPNPIPIVAHESLSPDQNVRWSQAEGTVAYASEQDGMLELELNSDAGRVHVEVADSSGGSPLLLLKSRVRVTGICLSTFTADGQSVADTLLAPGMDQIELLEVPAEQWSTHPTITISSLTNMTVLPSAEAIFHVHGKIRSRPDGGLFIEDETGTVPLKMTKSPAQSEGVPFEILGRLEQVDTNLILQSSICQEITSGSQGGSTALPVLNTVEQIKRLDRHEWDRGYPVKIRGVITSVLDNGFFIHDSSGSIYARWHPPTDNDVPRAGDFWEIDGTTFVEFAPNIQVKQATSLGRGTLPEPLRPTWDQLINGSLDTEYVEVQGIVTTIEPSGVTLLTRTGKISIQLPDVEPAMLNHYENALIRIRGCIVPVRNIRTQQVELGQIAMINTTIDIDKPAPTSPFSGPLEHASDLLLFDPRAGALQQVKIAGQIVHERNGEFFLMDGHDGLRFFSKTNIVLNTGDLVQVVGFPELGGPSPVLREAKVRRLGTAPLPVPQVVPKDAIFSRRYDATLVQMQAHLTGISRNRSDQVLELETGTRRFVARLNTSNGLLPDLSPGSLLEITGVYDGQGGDLASGHEIDSFDLLLNSSASITVLARPSWWTLRHMLTVIGVMALAILAAMVWIMLLHRQVEERSSQLAAEVQRREHTERQRELEKERARIARDLHDDLGATLTQIRFLSAIESRDTHVPEGARERMGRISEKSHEMVASLDEIVWAVNPVNDSTPNLANYLCHFAEEFFRPTPIRCRLDVDDSLPPASFTSEVRHNCYLAVREALNNISKHSQATEAWLRIKFQASQLCITIEDNGCGFSQTKSSSGEGLANMRQRLERIGGSFEIETRPGGGTICQFRLPLESAGGVTTEQLSKV